MGNSRVIGKRVKVAALNFNLERGKMEPFLSNLFFISSHNLELESQPIESNKDCKPLSNPKNLKLGGESNSDPIRLQRQQLKLLNLCIHSAHKNRVKLTLHGLTHERKVPNQHLRIFPSNSYMA